jgi:ATP-dependent RNA helicase RhlE
MSADTTESRTTFEELGLASELLEAVRDAGYEHPTPIQEQAIPLVLRGRDVIGLAHTGTGKTAAFTLPIIQRLLGGPTGRVRALVLTPTRELAAQVRENFAASAAHTPFRVLDVFGGVPLEPQQDALR